MLEREYEGPAIDATEQYVSERSEKGETVGGTTEDDLFSQNTDWLPTGMDESDFTDKQKKALRAFLAQSDRTNVTPAGLAKGNDFSKETARRAIHKAFPDARGFEDVSDSLQLAIEIYALEGVDTPQEKLAERYPISSRAFGEAKRVYPDLIKERTPIDNQKVQASIEKYKKNHQKDGRSKQQRNETRVTQKAKEEKEYPEDFSDTYQWFVETIAENPGMSKGEIGELIPEDAGFSEQNYYNVIRDYGHVVGDRIREKGTASTKDEMSDYLAKHVEEFDGESATSDETSKTQPTETAPNNVDRRLRAVESKTESLRQEVESIDIPTASENPDLASALLESLPDEKLGALVREEILNG